MEPEEWVDESAADADTVDPVATFVGRSKSDVIRNDRYALVAIVDPQSDRRGVVRCVGTGSRRYRGIPLRDSGNNRGLG